MKLKAWWQWVISKPLYLRWFIYFLLIRPVAEQYYNLKEISPLLSPLYWLGALTFLFSLYGILMGKRIKSNLDNTILIWTWLTIASVTALFFSSSDLLVYLNYSIKLTLPVLLYFFLRVFIRDKSDYTGLMTTFMLSCIFPVVSLVLGLFEGRIIGGERFAGSYADVFNNAFYLSAGTIALLYHYILNRTYSNMLKISNFLIFMALIVSLIGMWVIRHMATIAVFISIIMIFIYVVFRKRRQAAVFLVILSALFVFFAGDQFYEEVVNPRIEYEVEVIEGSRDIDQAVHGRMSRWTWLMGDFRAAPLVAKIAGYPLSLKRSSHMITITPHNDFLRILFFIGYAGILVYLILLFKIFRKAKYRDLSDKFSIYALLATTMLYSVTTVPTFYPGFINIMMMTFAYTALPVIKPAKRYG